MYSRVQYSTQGANSWFSKCGSGTPRGTLEGYQGVHSLFSNCGLPLSMCVSVRLHCHITTWQWHVVELIQQHPTPLSLIIHCALHYSLITNILILYGQVDIFTQK